MSCSRMTKLSWYQYADLYLLLSWYGLTAILIYLAPHCPLRIVGAVLCILFGPGYVLLAAVYPLQRSLSCGQRWFASVSMSIVVSSLIETALAYTVGTALYSSFGVLSSFILMMALVAGYRRTLISPADRFYPALLIPRAWPRYPYRRHLSGALAVAIILVVVGAVRLFWVSQQTQAHFTEFYLLDSAGQAGNYIEAVRVDRPVTLTVGIVNHEGHSTTYDLSYLIGDGERKLKQGILLSHKERWEDEVQIPPLAITGRQRVTLVLREAGDQRPTSTLYLWLTARFPAPVESLPAQR